jgi:hypothetical protein
VQATTGRLNLSPEEVAEVCEQGRVWMNIGFLPGAAALSLTYGTDPEDGQNDRKFSIRTYRHIMGALTAGQLKLVHYGASVYRVRVR